MTRTFDVIVLGGGAAGLMCALTAGQRGRRVLVLERANKLGKKILMSGGGRCNITNLHVEPDRYLSANPHFCKSALSRYTQWDFIDLVDRHRIAWHEKETINGLSGQLFCDESAKQIVAMLVAECRRGGVEILTDCETERVVHGERFELRTSHGDFAADRLVIATGGLSIPRMGGSGYGYELAEQFGLTLLPRRAGLVPFTVTDANQALTERLAGISADVTVACNGQQFREEMLFTHRGLSGPAMLQISSYWTPGDALTIDLAPGDDLLAALLDARTQRPRLLLRSWLTDRLVRSLVSELESRYWPDRAEQPLAEWGNSALGEVASVLQAWTWRPAATEGYRTAEVTLGGVDTHQLSSQTMEVRDHPGLYLIGEVVDVTGHLGGFNFQWAWSSGWAAGMSV